MSSPGSTQSHGSAFMSISFSEADSEYSPSANNGSPTNRSISCISDCSSIPIRLKTPVADSGASPLSNHASAVTATPWYHLRCRAVPDIEFDEANVIEPKNFSRYRGNNNIKSKCPTVLDEVADKENIPPIDDPAGCARQDRDKHAPSQTTNATTRRLKRSFENEASLPSTTTFNGSLSILTLLPTSINQPAINPSPHAQPQGAASRPPPPLRRLHLAIGQHRIDFLPKFSSLRYDSITNDPGYIPLAVLLGSYLPADHHSLIRRTWSIWAYQTMPPSASHWNVDSRVPIELTAFNAQDEHVSEVPGIGLAPVWNDIQQFVNLRPEFTLVRSISDIVALLRYALLLAADKGLLGPEDAENIPRGIGFPHQLVEIGERGWEEDRWKTFQDTGVWKGRKRWGILEGEREVYQVAEVWSGSESEGDDEIPHVKPTEE